MNNNFISTIHAMKILHRLLMIPPYLYRTMKGINYSLMQTCKLSLSANVLLLGLIIDICDLIYTLTIQCQILGIHIYEHLTWKYYTAHVNTKVSISLFLIKQLTNSLPRDDIRTLYFALVHSHYIYGLLAWEN